MSERPISKCEFCEGMIIWIAEDEEWQHVQTIKHGHQIPNAWHSGEASVSAPTTCEKWLNGVIGMSGWNVGRFVQDCEKNERLDDLRQTIEAFNSGMTASEVSAPTTTKEYVEFDSAGYPHKVKASVSAPTTLNNELPEKIVGAQREWFSSDTRKAKETK